MLNRLEIVPLNSLEQYYSIVNGIKKTVSNMFSNIYFTSDQIERYIKQKRAYYSSDKNRFLLYLDEGLYYRVCMCIDIEKKTDIPKADKKMYVKYIYLKERDEKFSTIMKDNSFVLEGTSVEFRRNIESAYEKMRNMERFINRMEESGFVFCNLTNGEFDKVEDLIIHSGILKDYHIPFRTDEEKKNLPAGTYMCIKKDGEVIAGSIGSIENGIGRLEDVVIKDEYKMKGLAPIIAYNRMKWMYENKVQYATGWILLNNQESLSYHSHFGDKQKEKYCDEWILNI